MLVVVLAGCSGVEEVADAGVDGTTEADADSADAAVDGAPGVLDGLWRVAWECVDGCAGFPPRPSLTYSDRLTVAGAALRWHDADCAECSAEHLGDVAGGACVGVAAGDELSLERASYRVCNAGESAQASVTWASIYGSPATTTWTATATRLQ